MKTSDADLVKAMANKLIIHRVDLGDERAVLRALNGALSAAGASKATSGDIMALYERAIEGARMQTVELGEL